ncbi:MAG: flagellar basal body L-ring protein FlgH [Gammaproteobacteria bacterium]
MNYVKQITRSVFGALMLLLLLANTGCVKPKDVRSQPAFAPTKPEVVQFKPKHNGAIYQEGMLIGLFDDIRPQRIGDILTIVLEETTSATVSSNTSAKKENSVDMPPPTVAGDKVTREGKEVLQNKIDAGRDFSGEGSSSQSNNLSGTITVTVAEVLANRNLVVRGEKLIVLNQSDEFVRFSGIVRPTDIRPDNTISSSRIADVRIAYAGQGALAAANTMGPLSRFFQSTTYPY